MRILFVRHGNPNYQNDCLTPLGKAQAEALSRRLVNEGIEEIYASTCGRAMETARYTADKLGLEITSFDFMREIDWSSVTGEPVIHNGNPWLTVDEYLNRDKPLVDTEWQNDEFFKKTKTSKSVEKLSKSLDSWLESLGYKREGNYYRVIASTEKTVAMFSHAGAFASSCSHLFNLPIPFVVRCIPCRQSSVIEIVLRGAEGELISPSFGDSYEISHLNDEKIEIT